MTTLSLALSSSRMPLLIIGDPHVWALGVVVFAVLAQLTVAGAFGQAATWALSGWLAPRA